MQPTQALNIALMIYDGPLNNWVKQSINTFLTSTAKSHAQIYFHYGHNSIPSSYIGNSRIKFIRLGKQWKNRRMCHKIELANATASIIPIGSKLLVLDCDLLFQNDPFDMFKHQIGDFYYTCVVMSLWRHIPYCVNGGVWGVSVNNNSRKLLNYWVHNLKTPEWKPWKRDYKGSLDWSCDQDFLNTLHQHHQKLPFKVTMCPMSFKFNYYTSKWGFFSPHLEMSRKIGDQKYYIIHFKGGWRDSVYQLNNGTITINPHAYNKLKQVINSRRVNGKYLCV